MNRLQTVPLVKQRQTGVARFPNGTLLVSHYDQVDGTEEQAFSDMCPSVVIRAAVIKIGTIIQEVVDNSCVTICVSRVGIGRVSSSASSTNHKAAAVMLAVDWRQKEALTGTRKWTPSSGERVYPNNDIVEIIGYLTVSSSSKALSTDFSFQRGDQQMDERAKSIKPQDHDLPIS